MDVKVALVIPDCHIPWHCKASYDILLQVAKDMDKDLGIDEVVILGDFLDFYWVGLHPKLPSHYSVKGTLKDEIYIGCQILQQLRDTFPNAKFMYQEGNHEFRLKRYLMAKAPELFDFFDIPQLLNMDSLDINFQPYGRKQLYKVLDTTHYTRHQPYSQGINCTSATLKKKHRSLGFGHTHRKQLYTVTTADKEEMTCYSAGWLGDVNAPIFDYVDTEDWVKSFYFLMALNEKQWWIDNVDIKTVTDTDGNPSLVGYHNKHLYTNPYREFYQGEWDDLS